MNGYRKNKGIVIELTALLDVIMIMLFWVMMNVNNGSISDFEEVERKTAVAEQRLKTVQEELDIKNAQFKRLSEMLRNINKSAADNQQALIGYESGMLITLDIQYDKDGKLIIYNSSDILEEMEISSETEISQCIENALEKAELDKDDVILCALIYDGSASLYKDVKKVNAAIDVIRSVYKNFYCAYINTASRSESAN